MTIRLPDRLPIEPLLPELRQALGKARSLVLEAPPGAGKTTLVPLALLEEPWLAGKRILMLEPRRLAARAAALRMAALLKEPIGETVGYRTRLDSKVGSRTRIEVLTEGILTRRLQFDPALEGVGLVIFDEFHERSLQADLGLALCLEVQALREDLRLLVMSATLDGAKVADLLGGAKRLTSSGRSHPVETIHLGRPSGRLEPGVASAVRRALAEAEGDILVFLPGEAEIRRTARALEEETQERLLVLPLYGALPPARQEAALQPAPAGYRKVVLASAVAETSLTIEGIRVVIDSGLSRRARFDPASGMTRLVTGPVSRATAEQRKGRAGRTAPGRCYRLWHEAEERALPPFDLPEILEADLAPLALELVAWGAADPNELAWLDPPPAAALAQARDLLRQLSALDEGGRITPHGRRLAQIGSHPRLAHMLLISEGKERRLACDIAALLSEGEILTERGDRDLRPRLDLLAGEGDGRAGTRKAALQRVRRASAQWQSRLHAESAHPGSEPAGRLLALAYPDRLAQRRGQHPGYFRMANGRGARLPPEDPLAVADWLVIASLEAADGDARIFLAAPITLPEIEELFADQITLREEISWDNQKGRVRAVRQKRLGALILGQEPLPHPPPDTVVQALLAAIKRQGLELLPWDEKTKQLRARVALLRRLEGPDDWPDWSDESLLERLPERLAPHLHGITRLEELQNLDLAEILLAELDWPRRQRLDLEAPTYMQVPSGRRHPIDYTQGEEALLAVKLQEMFGTSETPRIAGGRIPLLLQLLSPAGRPLQVTRDLATFWQRGYREVRAEMRGRYPKHPWPEDPASATATARTKRHV